VLRYPGSKYKISQIIVSQFPDALRLGALFNNDGIDYREPFFGSGAIGFSVLKHLGSKDRVWINDLDRGIVRLWKSVKESPEELCERIRTFTPNVEKFYEFKADDGCDSRDPVESGFRKLALHQMSFSGLGVKAGGPIGGRNQSSEYNVQCRWNAPRLCHQIQRRSKLLNRIGNGNVKITRLDFSKVLADVPGNAFIYADPPYVEKGDDLYAHAMSLDDHRRLAMQLRTCPAPWVLSYDDHPFIRELYAWAIFRSVNVKYTVATSKTPRRKNSEIIITPRD
jgi:DNA adenine methylase